MRSQYVPEWVARLKEARYPDTVLLLDFETFFDSKDKYSLRSMSTIEYIQDPRFEIIGLGSLVMTGKYPFADYKQQTRFTCGPDESLKLLEYYQGEYGKDLEGCTVVAQNAPFDAGILSFRLGIHPRYLIDILGLARAWDSRNENDLDALCERWGLERKGDTSQFDRMTYRTRILRAKGRGKGPKLPTILPTATMEQEMDLMVYGSNDVMREWEVFTLLLPKLSAHQMELRVMQHTLELYTKPTIAVDEAKATELTTAMTAEIDKACEAAGITVKDASGDKAFEQALRIALTGAGDDLNKYLKPSPKVPGKMLLAIAKADPEREVLTKHPAEPVRKLMAARQAVDSWPLHIARIGRIVNQCKAAGGLLPVPLKYCGAHTWRWSGGEKINLQNLGTRGHPLTNAIREMLMAPSDPRLVELLARTMGIEVPAAGFEFAIADLSAIEARVLAWIAGQEDLVQQFRDQDANPAAVNDVYTNFATKILGWPVRKPSKKGIAAIEARHKWGRNSIGKVGILGCGYGMGPNKCEAFANGAIDLPTATLIVQSYRREHPAITQFWRDVERCFSNTLRYGNENRLARGLKFYPDGDVTIIELPSGHQLKYHEVRITEDGLRLYNPVEHTWIHIWGGYLVENIVQSMSRHLLAGSILAIEDAGIHVPHSVHDEVIGIVPKGEGEKAFKKMVSILSTTPKWAEGCPLAAEGKVSQRYGDH